MKICILPEVALLPAFYFGINGKLRVDIQTLSSLSIRDLQAKKFVNAEVLLVKLPVKKFWSKSIRDT